MFGGDSTNGFLGLLFEGSKSCRALFGAWLAKEKLVARPFVTLELWRWPTISRVVYDWLGIYQHTSHCLRSNGAMANAIGSLLHAASLVDRLLFVGL